MTLGEREVQVDAVVAEMVHDGILGLETLVGLGATLDFARGQMAVGEHVMSAQIPTGMLVEAVGSVIVPAGSEMILEGDILSGEQSVPSMGVMRPMYRGEDSEKLMLPVALVRVEDRRTRTTVLNPTEESVAIVKGSILGRIEPVQAILDRGGCEVGAVEPGPGPEADIPLSEPLEEMIDGAAGSLSPRERTQLAELIREFRDVFLEPGGTLGRTSVVRHKIETGDARPIKQAVRRAPVHQQAMVEEEVDKMKKSGVIRESESPWSSPIVLVKKKDGSTRFCVDYRRLNEVTVKDAYPLPRIDDCFDTLNGHRYFSTLDLASGYWQVEMEPEDKAKTAFATRSGLYEFQVMPFGLATAPATFERLMEIALRGLQWKRCLVYLDDIITLGRDVGDALEGLRQVLVRIRLAGTEYKHFDLVYGRLERKFGTATRAETYKTELRNHRKKAEETLVTYGDGVERLVDLAYPQLPEDLRQTMLVDAFIRGLPPGQLRVQTQLHKFKELAAAVDFTLHYEQAEQEGGMARKPVVRAVGAVDPPETETTGERGVAPVERQLSGARPDSAATKGDEVGQLVSLLKRVLEAMNSSERAGVNKRTRGDGCFRCGKSGHFRRDCPEKPKEDKSAAKTDSQRTSGN